MDSLTYTVRRTRLLSIGNVTVVQVEDAESLVAFRVVFYSDGSATAAFDVSQWYRIPSERAQVLLEMLYAIGVNRRAESPEAFEKHLQKCGIAERSEERETIDVLTEPGEIQVWLPAGLGDELRELALAKGANRPTSSLLSQLQTPELEGVDHDLTARRGYRFAPGSKARKDMIALLQKAVKMLDRRGDWPWVVEAELAIKLLADPLSDTLLSGAAKAVKRW